MAIRRPARARWSTTWRPTRSPPRSCSTTPTSTSGRCPRNVYRTVLARGPAVRPDAVRGLLGRELFDALGSVAAMAGRHGVHLGETYILGDSPLVLLTALQSSFHPDPASSTYVSMPCPASPTRCLRTQPRRSDHPGLPDARHPPAARRPVRRAGAPRRLTLATSRAVRRGRQSALMRMLRQRHAASRPQRRSPNRVSLSWTSNATRPRGAEQRGDRGGVVVRRLQGRHVELGDLQPVDPRRDDRLRSDDADPQLVPVQPPPHGEELI